jgi:3-oxoadipate enol-lactonase
MRIQANGIDIHYEIHGEGPWLTFSHSLAADLHMWDPQIKTFASGYRVLAYDTRGHGQSGAPAGAYSLDMLADDLKGLYDALGIRHSHFVGLSMGGMIGQTFALKYPGVFQSLTLADTTSRYGPDAGPLWAGRIKTAEERGMEPLVEPSLGRWFTAGYQAADPAGYARAAEMIRRTPAQGYAGCCHALPQINATGRLHEIGCPILVICGEQDMGTPRAMAEEIQSHARGAELVMIPSAAHISNLEQPGRFNQALSGFLARVPAHQP